MKRALIALAGALAAVALAAAPAMATSHPGHHAKRIPSNPLHIKQASGGDLYIAADDISAGNPVKENFVAGARNVTWVPSGGNPYNGAPVGYLKLSNGNPIAAITSPGTNECQKVTIKSDTTSNGTVWAWNTATGNLMINRYCAQLLDPDWALAGTNSPGDQWSIHDAAPGYYRNLSITHSS